MVFPVGLHPFAHVSLVDADDVVEALLAILPFLASCQTTELGRGGGGGGERVEGGGERGGGKGEERDGGEREKERG